MAVLIPALGIIGGGLFAFAAVPAAIKTALAGKSLGTPVDIAWAITGGCVCLYSYLTGTYGFDWILTGVYGIETVSWATILFFHYRPRSQ